MVGRTKPEQQSIDFTSRANEEWALIRSLHLKPKASNCYARFLLETMNALAKRQPDGTQRFHVPSLGWLSERLSLPYSSLRDAIKALTKLGILKPKRKRLGPKKQVIDYIDIDFDAIRKTIKKIRETREHSRDSHNFDETRESTDGSRDDIDETREKIDESRRALVQGSQESPTSPSSKSVEELVSEILSNWKKPISEARENGCDDADIVAIAEHWRRHRGMYSEGCLYHRLVNAHPTQDPSTGWPPPQSPSKKVADAIKCLRSARAHVEATDGLIDDVQRFEKWFIGQAETKGIDQQHAVEALIREKHATMERTP